jgi:hypothetical protein
MPTDTRPAATGPTGDVLRLRLPGRTLRGTWFDLARGHNLEIYLTAMLSFGLGLLGVFDIVKPRVVGVTTVGTLALLAIFSLGTRHRFEQVRATVRSLPLATGNMAGAGLPVDRFLAVAAPDLDNELRSATDIRLVGVTLSRTVQDLAGTLARRLRAGATLRVIVIDPDSDAPLEAAARTLGVTSPEYYRPQVASTMDVLTALTLLPGADCRIEARLLPFVPAFGMYLIDPAAPDGRIHVELYQHRSIEPNPCLGLRAERDDFWYRCFVDQFDTLWDSARPAPEFPASTGQPR